MILALWTILFLVAVVFIAIGYLANIEVMKIVGFAFIFLLGIVPLFDSIEYKTGDTINKTGDFYTVTSVYSDFQDNMWGLLISAIGVLGWVIVYIQYKADKRFVDG